jgi:hypothetical protein
MPPSLASERATVQDPLITYAVEIGWAYICETRLSYKTMRCELGRKILVGKHRAGLKPHRPIRRPGENIETPTLLIVFGILRNVHAAFFQ